MQGLTSLYGQTTQGADLAWDAENRLVTWTPKAPQAGDQKITFAYDYLSRRVVTAVCGATMFALAVPARGGFFDAGWKAA